MAIEPFAHSGETIRKVRVRHSNNRDAHIALLPCRRSGG
jgi:hypothetical protein